VKRCDGETSYIIRDRRAGFKGIEFPKEPDFVQKFLPIKPNFVLAMKAPLLTNPIRKRRVFHVPLWDDTMALLSLPLDHFFILIVPFLVSSDLNFPNEPEFVQKLLSIVSNFVICACVPLRTSPPT
jgi:hypothetical protein